MKDYYKILGVSNDADDKDIKKAYRKISLENHPDKNPSPQAHETFKEASEAYEVLQDKNKRSEYDTKQKFKNIGGKAGFPETFHGHFPGGFPGGFPGVFPGGFPGGFPFSSNIRVHHNTTGHPDIDNLFDQNTFHHFFSNFDNAGKPGIRIFKNGRSINITPKKPEPIKKIISITLEQAYNGFQVNLEVERILENDVVIEEMPIDVPQGVEDGQTIILKEMGNLSPEKIKGDVHITFNVESHEIFKRDGIDLICKKEITLKEALTDFSIEILHLNSKILRISNTYQNNIIYPGFQKYIEGYGMIQKGEIGNLILEFDVIFPSNLTEEQKNQLKCIL